MKVSEIQKGIEIPPKEGKYGFLNRMHMGDMVQVTLDAEDKPKALKAGIRSAAARIGHKVHVVSAGDGALQVWKLPRPEGKPAPKKTGKKPKQE